MNAAPQSVADSALGGYLHARVQRAQQTLSATDWRQYLGALQELPALLRENGLAQSLGFLALQAQKKPGVARLLADWLGPEQGEGGLAGLCEAQADTGLKPLRDVRGPHYPHNSRMAVREVQRLLRSAKALHALLGISLRPEQSASPPAAPLALAAQTQVFGPNGLCPDQHEHLGLVWRYAGLPDAPAGSGQPAGHYKAEHIADVLALAAKAWGDTAHAALYQRAYGRWQTWLHGRASHCEVQVAGRLQLGLGSPTVFETQVLLHPVHGLPYIPGSTLKGALRAHLGARVNAHLADTASDVGDAGDASAQAAHSLTNMMRDLFGEQRDDGTGNAGELTLLDAWWIPGSGKPLVREVETPHHAAYYAGRTDVASAFDSPIPVPQLATEGRFLLAIAHTRIGKAWADHVLEWLLAALADPAIGGLGAKAFSAGGGRLHRVPPVAPVARVGH